MRVFDPVSIFFNILFYFVINVILFYFLFFVIVNGTFFVWVSFEFFRVCLFENRIRFKLVPPTKNIVEILLLLILKIQKKMAITPTPNEQVVRWIITDFVMWLWLSYYGANKESIHYSEMLYYTNTTFYMCVLKTAV